MADPKMNVGISSNDRRMFEISIAGIGRITCEASTKLPGATAGREGERKDLAKINGKQLSEALTKAIGDY